MATILLADADDDRIAAVRELVRREGHRTVVARDGKDTLERAIKSHPAVVIADTALPGLDGYGLALSIREEVDADTVRIAVDRGVDPPLVWIANGAGRGTLLQLAGDNLSLKGSWAGDDDKLSSPGQYGFVSILNIDPETGHLYVEDDSYYHRGLYGEVYRLSQDGEVLKKWPPLPFTTWRRCAR